MLRPDARDKERFVRATECIARATSHPVRATAYAVCLRQTLRQCTVLFIVWVTVHRHCSQTMFMDTVKKKYKNDPRDSKRHSYEKKNGIIFL